MYIVIFIFAAIYLWWRYMTRIPNVGDMTEVTGGIKSGKTLACVYWGYKQYRQASRKFYKNTIKALRSGRSTPERPHFYTNMPVGDFSVALSKDHIRRNARFTYGSIVYINEASIVNGSMDYKDSEINDQLLEFYKLIAHELGTHGKYTKAKGHLWIDTQAPEDVHFAVKRSLSSVLFIRKSIKLPFMHLLKIQILHPNLNVYEQSQEDEASVSPWLSERPRWYIVPHYPTYKLYDCYAYSALTDDKPVQADPNPDNLKVKKLLRAARNNKNEK